MLAGPHFPKAVVLLSGGLDSATVLALAAEQGFELHALTVQYGQRHACEIRAASAVANAYAVAAHVIENIDLRLFGGSALTGSADVPKHGDVTEMDRGIPITYVPARNTILLALALGFAESRGAADIFIGVNAVDYSGYPDCRPAFVKAFEQLANVATRDGVEGRPFRIHAPLINLTKAEIIREGLRLGVNYGLTHSCYDPRDDGAACARCDSCLLRLQGFAQSGVTDPIRYV